MGVHQTNVLERTVDPIELGATEDMQFWIVPKRIRTKLAESVALVKGEIPMNAQKTVLNGAKTDAFWPVLARFGINGQQNDPEFCIDKTAQEHYTLLERSKFCRNHPILDFSWASFGHYFRHC